MVEAGSGGNWMETLLHKNTFNDRSSLPKNHKRLKEVCNTSREAMFDICSD